MELRKVTNEVTKEIYRRGMNIPGYLRLKNEQRKSQDKEPWLYETFKAVIHGRLHNAEIETELQRDGLWHLIAWQEGKENANGEQSK